MALWWRIRRGKESSEKRQDEHHGVTVEKGRKIESAKVGASVCEGPSRRGQEAMTE